MQYKKLPEQHALALIDLDHFKRINDTYGHDAGDHVLKAVANLLQVHFNDTLVARFGGEEFCVYLPKIDLNNAQERLNRFRIALEKMPIQLGEESVKVTCSIGLCNTPTQNIETLLSSADKLLYKAKHAGRNQVYLNSETQEV